MEFEKEKNITKIALQAFEESMGVIVKRLEDVDLDDRLPALIITLSIFESKLYTLTAAMPVLKGFRDATLKVYKNKDLRSFEKNVMPHAPVNFKPKKDR